MKTNAKNLDDIVFENRNKDYGAYSLRKNYNKNMMSAVIIAITVFLLGVSVPLIANYFSTGKGSVGPDDIIVIMEPTPKKVEIAKLPEAPMEKKKERTYRAPVVTTNDAEVPDDLMDLMDLARNEAPTDTSGTLVDVPEDKPNTKVIDDEDVSKPPTIVEEMPEFPGGDVARIKFLAENTKYPDVAKQTGIQGPVYLTFVVEKDGSITNVKILRGIGGGCDDEAMRVAKLMPKWNPGRQNGKEVRVQMNMPTSFILRD